MLRVGPNAIGDQRSLRNIGASASLRIKFGYGPIFWVLGDDQGGGCAEGANQDGRLAVYGKTDHMVVRGACMLLLSSDDNAAHI